jgi:hypothetical protein
LLGFGEVQVEEVVPPEPAVNEPDNNSTSSNTTTNNATEPPAASESAPTPGPRTRASPPVGTVAAGIQNNASRDRSVNPGAFVAAAVAALTLMLVAVFVAKRQRDRSTDSISKHREFHDDEDNDSDLGNETDDNTAMTPIPATPQSPPPPPQQRLAYIVGDDESWNTARSSAVGQEILASPALTELLQHGPHVTCSSPNCDVCELKRQMGTKFVASNAAMDSPPREELPPRRYEAEDTVSL